MTGNGQHPEPWEGGWLEVARPPLWRPTEVPTRLMLCPNGHYKFVRTDVFLPGAHCLVCVQCQHSGSAVRLLDGSEHRVTQAARAASGS